MRSPLPCSGAWALFCALAILNALELSLPDAPAFALRLLQFGACLLVGLGAYRVARAHCELAASLPKLRSSRLQLASTKVAHDPIERRWT
jgi:hypothetical protein